MNGDERIEIASRWATALGNKGARPLTALADVLDDDVVTPNLTGKDAVLEWFGTWKSASMFKTGEWEPATVAGDVVTLVNKFDPRAAFHSATLSITVASTGRITRASMIAYAAPDPLGAVIHRVWGARNGATRLGDHLAATYGVHVKKQTQLDNGVFRIDRVQGAPWIVRLFPPDRPIADVKGDAAVLRFLESKDFPAERCIADVSDHEGQGVLVTEFISGKKPQSTTATERKLGDLLGRLHALSGAPKAVRRDAGALHLFTADCTVKSEIETARACLDAGAFRGTDKKWEALRGAIDRAPSFDSLPKALIHPDPATVNAITIRNHPVLIDWAGAGFGPRILGLGLLLVAPTAGKMFNREWTDAIIGAYSKHVKLTTAELDHLEAAIEHRLLIHEIYTWCVGMATQRKPSSRKCWPQNNEGIVKMADHIRASL